MINIYDLIKIYNDEISKNVKNKKSLYAFELNKMQNFVYIKNLLEKGEVGHKRYNIFLIHEPKQRLIMSLGVKDKIINHYVTRHILEPNLEKYLDYRNVATRKKMGTDKGIRLVKKYCNYLKNKYETFYVLKLDISKYFYSIDHTILKSMLSKKLNKKDFLLVSKIIDSTNNEFIFNYIKSLDKYYGPHYTFGKGLPIGNMTSQFLSIFYLSELDHYIIHNLGLKYMVRYMDDYIIFSDDKEKLKNALQIIVNKLENDYKLKVSYKKTFITNSKNGFSFLGYNFNFYNNKMVLKIKNSSLKRIRKNINKRSVMFNKGQIDLYHYFCSLSNFRYGYKHASNIKIRNYLKRLFYV